MEVSLKSIKKEFMRTQCHYKYNSQNLLKFLQMLKTKL